MSFTRLVNRLSNPKILPRFQIAIFLLFAVLLLLQMFNSLQWRLEHDNAVLQYTAFMIDRLDMVPYRDFFEANTPGTFAFHTLVARITGYNTLAYRLVDLGLLAVLLTATYLFMSRFGRWSALWAALLFGLLYLRRGQGFGPISARFRRHCCSINGLRSQLPRHTIGYRPGRRW